jgi:hypothetical protein
VIAPILHQQPSLITRRSIFRGAAASLIFAPAIVRATSLMPVRRLRAVGHQYAGFVERLYFHALDSDLRVGQMSTHLNGKIVSMADARQRVARARTYGLLPACVRPKSFLKGEGLT